MTPDRSTWDDKVPRPRCHWKYFRPPFRLILRTLPRLIMTISAYVCVAHSFLHIPSLSLSWRRTVWSHAEFGARGSSRGPADPWRGDFRVPSKLNSPVARQDSLIAWTLLRVRQRAIYRLETETLVAVWRNPRDSMRESVFHPSYKVTCPRWLHAMVIVEIRDEVRSLSQECSAHGTPVVVFEVPPRRLYCEVRDHRVFITPNDLSRGARASWLDSARRSECFWARTTEREATAREERRRRGTLGTTGFDYSGPRRSHEGALEQQVSNTYTYTLFIDLPGLELRAAQDKPPGLLVFLFVDRRRNPRPY